MVVESPGVLSPNKILQDEQIAQEVVASDADQDGKKAEEERRQQQLREFGGRVSLCKLLSLASGSELFVLFVGVIGAIAHGTGQPLLCLMFGDLIDSLATSEAPDPDAFLVEVGKVALRFTLIGIGVSIVGTLQGFAFPYFAEAQVRKMRPLYFQAALYRDVGWFDTHDAAALPTEMGADLDAYAEAFGNQLGASIMSISCVIFGIAFGIFLSWKVGLVILATLPVMALGGLAMGKAVMDMMQEMQGPYVKAATLVMETLFAVRTVVSFGGEEREIRRYTVEIDKAKWGGIRARAKTGFGMGYIWMAYFGAMALAFWYGMTLRYDGDDLSVGNMMACFFCVLTSGFTMGQVPPGLIALVKARSATARFFWMVDNESEIQKRKQDNRLPMGPIQSMSLDNVHFAYPARPDIRVLNGLSLSVQKGQKVAVVGESGSGKSTVMALLERFYDPVAGRVMVNGQDLKEFSVKSFRAQVGYVGQEPVLFATSVRANIMQGSPNTTDADVERVARHAQLAFIDELPDRFETWVGSGGSQFSGGQKQRIAIARALIKNPSVLFLDEATSALDNKSERMIQDTIDKIGSSSELGITIVTIAHRLSTIKNSDIIYVLSGGRVAEQGSHRELTAKTGGLYQALAAAQEMADDQKDQSQQQVLQRQTTPEYGDEKKQQNRSKVAASDKEQDEEARTREISKHYKAPLRRLAALCKPEWCFFPLGVIAAMGSGAGFPVLGTFFLVDAMVAFLRPMSERDQMKKEVEEAALWFAIVGLIKWLCTFLQFTCFAILGESMTKRARVEMLTSVMRQEVGFHDDPENTPGRLAKALQIYAYRIQALCICVGDVSDALCCVILGILMAFLYSWEMTCAMLLSIPVFAIAQLIQVVVLMGSTKSENAYLRSAQQILADALINSRTVQAAGCEQDCLNLYSRMLQPSKSSCRKHILGGAAFGLSNGVMFWVCSAGFWFMGWLIERGRTNFAEGQRSFMGVLYAGFGAGLAFALTGNLAKAKVAAHDMFALIDRKSKINGLEPDGISPDSCQVGRFEFKDVRFLYPFRPDVQVLQGVSFTIEAGQSVGICGPSGGGKSTVMSMIQRFYDPQSGSILIGSSRVPLNSINIRWWREQIGFVGQEPILFDTTVLENVKYGLRGDELISQERLDECKRMAHLTFLDNQNSQGWETQVGPRGARLSGGQKQRVAICRALVRNPPVLLLDEATSALDSQSEKVVSEALDNARLGRTSFAIAHRLSTISDCDVILVVSEGKIVEKGSHFELLQEKGVYWKLQAQVSSGEACAGANLQKA